MLDWDQPVPVKISSKRIDLLLVADCMYNVDSACALVNVITAIMEKSPDALLVIAHKKRHDSEIKFFDLMKRFTILDTARIGVGEVDAVHLYTMRLVAAIDKQ